MGKIKFIAKDIEIEIIAQVKTEKELGRRGFSK